MSQKIFRQPNRLAGRIAQLFCVVLLLTAGSSLYAEEPPELWKFGGDAQPIDKVLQSHKSPKVLQSHKSPKITRRENSVQKVKKKELSKKQVLRTDKQEDSSQLSNPAVPDMPRNAGTSKLKLKKERPQTSGLSVRATGVLQQNRATSGTHHLREDNTTLGDAHLLLMGTDSEIRFRGIGREKSQKARPISVLELPSEKPKLVVKKISHTVEERAAPAEQESVVSLEQESAVATDEKRTVPLEVPIVQRDNEIVTKEFLRSASPLTFGKKENTMPNVRQTDKVRRPKRIQGPFGYSR